MRGTQQAGVGPRAGLLLQSRMGHDALWQRLPEFECCSGCPRHVCWRARQNHYDRLSNLVGQQRHSRPNLCRFEVGIILGGLGPHSAKRTAASAYRVSWADCLPVLPPPFSRPLSPSHSRFGVLLLLAGPAVCTSVRGKQGKRIQDSVVFWPRCVQQPRQGGGVPLVVFFRVPSGCGCKVSPKSGRAETPVGSGWILCRLPPPCHPFSVCLPAAAPA